MAPSKRKIPISTCVDSSQPVPRSHSSLAANQSRAPKRQKPLSHHSFLRPSIPSTKPSSSERPIIPRSRTESRLNATSSKIDGLNSSLGKTASLFSPSFERLTIPSSSPSDASDGSDEFRPNMTKTTQNKPTAGNSLSVMAPSGMLWCDKHAPAEPSELAVHPNKLALIRSWLQDALRGSSSVRKYRRLLILGGPAGCGKSTIIHALSCPPQTTSTGSNAPALSSFGNSKRSKTGTKAEIPLEGVGYEILEWTNSGNESGGSRLKEFPIWLTRASFGPTLSFQDQSQDPTDPLPASSNSTRRFAGPQPSTNPKLLLVDDLPNIYHGETLSTFCEALRHHLNSSRVSAPPLVVIISDTTVRQGQNGLDDALAGVHVGNYRSGRGLNSEDRGMNVHSLLPADVLHHPGCCLVKLNATNNTLLKKMLNRVLEQNSQRTSNSRARTKRPSATDIDWVVQASGGDIRAALNNLQLLFENANLATPLVGRNAKSSRKEKASASSLHRSHNALLSCRDESLVIFHGLGKVLYNKRWGDDLADDAKDKRFRPPKPDDVPFFFKSFSRRQMKTNIDELYSDMSVPVDRFITYLHQNYPPFTNEVDEMSVLLEYLSIADSTVYLNDQRWTQTSLSALYQFQISVRGIAIALPSPVPRRSQKLLKPVSWDHQRLQVEHSDELESFRYRQSLRPSVSLGVQERLGLKNFDRALERMESVEEEIAYSSLANLSKKVMAIEVVPFLGLIARARPSPALSDPLIAQLCLLKYPTHKNQLTQVDQVLSEDDDGDDEFFDQDHLQQQPEMESAIEIDKNQLNLKEHEQIGLMDLSRNHHHLHHDHNHKHAYVGDMDHDDEKLWFEDNDDIEDF